jgi:hypothetical protein
MSNSLAEEQACNYEFSKEGDDEVTCLNCISYGVFENNKLKVPCVNCANDNNFTWGGVRCYGSLGDGEIDTEEFANNMYFLRYLNRHQVFREDAMENKTTCIDEMIKGIPQEAITIFINLVNNREREVCDFCKPTPVSG